MSTATQELIAVGIATMLVGVIVAVEAWIDNRRKNREEADG